MARPRLNSSANAELDKAQEQFDAFEKNVKKIEVAAVSDAPAEEKEEQTKLSKKEIRNAKDIYLKPKRTIFPSPDKKSGEAEKFNEKFREDYEFQKQCVRFIAENHEIIGETISDIWTRPFGGLPAESWDVPVNVPVWGPRYLAEQIKRKCYTRFIMEDKPTTTEGGMTYYGAMKVEMKKQRLNAVPAHEGFKASNF
jgi:hypothetical protein